MPKTEENHKLPPGPELDSTRRKEQSAVGQVGNSTRNLWGSNTVTVPSYRPEAQKQEWMVWCTG